MRHSLKQRYFKEPKSHYFLFGPRGTGKTTWLRTHHPDSYRIDLLDHREYRRYLKRPEYLIEILHALTSPTNIVIDEIQLVPELLWIVHLLIEEKLGHRFVLTGSSARKLKRAGVDLLAGRAVVKELHPFMASEYGKDFSLDHGLKVGMLPVILDAEEPSDALSAYARTYIEQEVQAEGLTRNVGNFARFLEAISFSHASTLTVANVARECEVGRKTVESYISILEDLLIAYKIPVFTKRAKRQTAEHPKFYFVDAGIFRTFRQVNYLDNQTEIEGQALEGLVAQHLRAWISYANSKSKLFFWRTRSGNEVDFILYGPEQFIAIEVKNNKRISSKDLSSLKSFKEDYPECTPYLLYRGKERLRIGKILCVPCEEFLLELHPNRDIRMD